MGVAVTLAASVKDTEQVVIVVHETVMVDNSAVLAPVGVTIEYESTQPLVTCGEQELPVGAGARVLIPDSDEAVVSSLDEVVIWFIARGPKRLSPLDTSRFEPPSRSCSDPSAMGRTACGRMPFG